MFFFWEVRSVKAQKSGELLPVPKVVIGNRLVISSELSSFKAEASCLLENIWRVPAQLKTGQVGLAHVASDHSV